MKANRTYDVKIGTKQFVQLSVLLGVVCLLAVFGVDVAMICSVVFMLFLVFICMKNFNSHSFFFFFLTSFFVYLMSGDIAEAIFDRHYYLQFGKGAVLHAHFCIMISLVSIFIGYRFTNVRRRGAGCGVNEEYKESDYIKSIRKASKTAYYVSYAVLLWNTFDIIQYVMRHGYVSYYVSYRPMLPQIIAEIGDFAPIALCVFLATFPSKKEASALTRLYILYALLSILTGSRGSLIYNLIFIICYYFYRNYTDRNETVWISKRMVYVLCGIVPFLLAFLFLYEYIRSGMEVQFSSLWETIVDFFVNIGASSKVIKYGYEYRDQIPQWRFYSLGETLNYFKYSPLFRIFNSGNIPAVHTAEYALNSHSFADLISYLSMKTQFLEGRGAGSSFIAVLFADFGYWGVAVGSFIYGIIFKKMSNISWDGWLVSSVKLYIFMSLLEAPRASYDGFIAAVVNVNYIVVMVSIWLLAKILYNKSKKNEGKINGQKKRFVKY